MSAEGRGSFDQLAHERYVLVKSASDKCRRVVNRVQSLRKKLRAAEVDMEQANRELRLAIDAVQPPLPVEPAPDEAELLPCCAAFDVYAEKPIHSADCTAS